MMTRQTDDSPTIIEPEFLVYPNKVIIPIYVSLIVVMLGLGIYLLIGFLRAGVVYLWIYLIPMLMALHYYRKKIRLLRPTDQAFLSLSERGIEIRDKGLIPWTIIQRTYLKKTGNRRYDLIIEYKSTIEVRKHPTEYFLERRYFDIDFLGFEAQLQLYEQKYITL